MNRKGFTLMEILFVLLLIALVVSFAMPTYRAVRFNIRNSRAKTALKKLAEARRTFYQTTRGGDLMPSSFKGGDPYTYVIKDDITCNNIAASGIPHGTNLSQGASQLFVCGFLNWKDFAGLPYTFYICNFKNKDASNNPALCKTAANATVQNNIYVLATGTAEAGNGYRSSDGYFMYVTVDMQVKDNKD